MSDQPNAPRDQTEDDALLAELRRLALTHDAIPPDVVAAARSALAFRTMDAELAELMADTSLDQEDLALVRGAGMPTLLTFESADLTVEVEVVPSGDRRRLLAQVVPPGPGRIEVRHKGGSFTVDADEVGRFSADDIVPGPVSLRCSVGASVVETDWFLA